MKLDYKQLAFILSLEPIEALEKILYVHSKTTGKPLPEKRETVREYLFVKDKGKNVRNELPDSLDLDLLAQYLNLPSLHKAVDDIQNNYLTRPGTKRYILLDYPEKELRTKPKDKIRIPAVLASLLKPEDIDFIKSEWFRRYGINKL